MTLQARLDEMLATAREATGGPWHRVLANRAHIAQSNPAVFAALVEAVKAAELVREMVPHGPDRYELETTLTALESALEANNAD